MKKKISLKEEESLYFLRALADDLATTQQRLEAKVRLILGLYGDDEEGWEMDLLYNDTVGHALDRMGVKVKKTK